MEYCTPSHLWYILIAPLNFQTLPLLSPSLISLSKIHHYSSGLSPTHHRLPKPCAGGGILHRSGTNSEQPKPQQRVFLRNVSATMTTRVQGWTAATNKWAMVQELVAPLGCSSSSTNCSFFGINHDNQWLVRLFIQFILHSCAKYLSKLNLLLF